MFPCWLVFEENMSTSKLQVNISTPILPARSLFGQTHNVVLTPKPVRTPLKPTVLFVPPTTTTPTPDVCNFSMLATRHLIGFPPRSITRFRSVRTPPTRIRAPLKSCGRNPFRIPCALFRPTFGPVPDPPGTLLDWQFQQRTKNTVELLSRFNRCCVLRFRTPLGSCGGNPQTKCTRRWHLH